MGQSTNYAHERNAFQDQIKLKRANEKAMDHKAQAEKARRDLIKERAKNTQLQK